MHEKAIFANTSLSDQAKITASSAAGLDVGPENLQYRKGGQIRGPRSVWRPAGIVDESITLEIDAAEWDLVALHYFNFSAAAVVRVDAANTEAGLGSSPTWTTGNVPGWKVSAEAMTRWLSPWVHWWTRAESLRSETWIRVTISDPAPIGGVMQGSGVMVAKAWRPPWHTTPEYRLTAIETPRVIDQPLVGVPLMAPSAAATPRQETVTISGLTTSDVWDAQNVFGVAGLAGPLWYQHAPDDPEGGLTRSIVGRPNQVPVFTAGAAMLHSAEITITEML